MVRKAFGLLLSLALSLSWAAPLCAQSDAPSHACCVGDEAPMPAPSKGQLPACCQVSASVPVTVAATGTVVSPALLSSVVVSAAPPIVERAAPARYVPVAPQAPPGTHSGLSPPSSGL